MGLLKKGTRDWRLETNSLQSPVSIASPALSTTTAVSDWLKTATLAHSMQAVPPRILHVFDQVCNLVDGNRRVISLVTPEIGKGPFSLVVDLHRGSFTDFITSESKVSIQTLPRHSEQSEESQPCLLAQDYRDASLRSASN